MNAMPATKQQTVPTNDHPRVRSANQLVPSMNTNETANGGTVISCALSPLNPRPDTIVGVKSEKDEKGTETAIKSV
jgi:hypothetical protein